MGKIKELKQLQAEEKRRKQIIKAAEPYLCDQPSGDLYGAYKELLDASEEGNGNNLADSYVVVWEPLANNTSVDEMIHLIECGIEEPELPEVLKNIDWAELRKQKCELLQVIYEEKKGKGNSAENLIGILHLLDGIQDAAVDEYGLDEILVFGEDNEEIEVCTGIKDTIGNGLYIGDKTKKVQLCAGCNSDNLDFTKTSPREFEGRTIIDIWCNDCQEFHPAYEAIMNKNCKVKGYQVLSNDDDANIHPDMAGSFCLYNLSQAREMIKKGCQNKSQSWRLLTCWTGDVEEPTLMFKGSPRK